MRATIWSRCSLAMLVSKRERTSHFARSVRRRAALIAPRPYYCQYDLIDRPDTTGGLLGVADVVAEGRLLACFAFM